MPGRSRPSPNGTIPAQLGCTSPSTCSSSRRQSPFPRELGRGRPRYRGRLGQGRPTWFREGWQPAEIRTHCLTGILRVTGTHRLPQNGNISIRAPHATVKGIFAERCTVGGFRLAPIRPGGVEIGQGLRLPFR
jgi:hypothetical protein